MSGKPLELHVDNAAEFKSEALRRGCEQHGIRLRYRPPGQPHFGGVIERVIGTMMQMVHELPGTTVSSTADRGSYDSGAKAVLTLGELQRWLALAVACYHGEVHETLSRTPAAVWAEKVAESGPSATVTSQTAFLVDFLPVIRRTLTRTGFRSAPSSTTATRSSRGSHAVSSWAGRFILRRDPRDISRVWALDPDGDAYLECRTGPCPGRRSARGSSKPRSPACASSAVPTSMRARCSRWWSRCARSRTPRRPRRARPVGIGKGAPRRRHGQSRRRHSRLNRTAVTPERGRSR